MLTILEVADQLGYHSATHETATHETAEKHGFLRSSFHELMEAVWTIVPDGPEKTIMFRKVQEGLMYANLAVAMTAPVDDKHAATARVLPGGLTDNKVGQQ